MKILKFLMDYIGCLPFIFVPFVIIFAIYQGNNSSSEKPNAQKVKAIDKPLIIYKDSKTILEEASSSIDDLILGISNAKEDVNSALSYDDYDSYVQAMYTTIDRLELMRTELYDIKSQVEDAIKELPSEEDFYDDDNYEYYNRDPDEYYNIP